MTPQEYDKIAREYSMLPELGLSYQFGTSARGLNYDKPLPGPQVGEQYGLYFNLQAMYGGVFGQIPKLGFNDMVSKMHETENQIDAKARGCAVPRPNEKANVFYSGSIYSFRSKASTSAYGKVAGYARSALLSDVVFSVNKTILSKIKSCETGRTPCCYVDGTFERRLMPGEIYNTALDWTNPKYRKQLEDDGWRQIIFNPFAYTHFQYLEPIVSPFRQEYKTFPVYSAELAVLMSQPRPWSAINAGGRPYLILAKNVNVDWESKVGWNNSNSSFVRKA